MAGIVQLETVGLRHGAEPEMLTDLELVLPRRTLRVLVGPVGAGKSTLLRLIMGTLDPSRGRVRAFGQDLAELDERRRAALRRRMGLVPQRPRLLPALTLAENIALPLEVAGLGEAEAGPRVAELLAWIGLDHRAGAPPAALDAHEARLATLARAVIGGAELLLIDEPGALEHQPRLVRLIDSLHRAGTTILLATRDVAACAHLPAAGLWRLERGGVTDLGAPDRARSVAR